MKHKGASPLMTNLFLLTLLGLFLFVMSFGAIHLVNLDTKPMATTPDNEIELKFKVSNFPGGNDDYRLVEVDEYDLDDKPSYLDCETGDLVDRSTLNYEPVGPDEKNETMEFVIENYDVYKNSVFVICEELDQYSSNSEHSNRFNLTKIKQEHDFNTFRDGYSIGFDNKDMGLYLTQWQN